MPGTTDHRARRAAVDGGGRWTGMPADERRAERRRLLLDAALGLLGEGGADAITVRAVCRAAQLNPRYFYESFPDRGALLVALYDDVAASLAGRVAERLSPVPEDLEAAVRAGIDTVFRFVADDPRRAQVLYTEALGDEALARRRLETVDDLVAALTGASPAPRPAGAATAIDAVTASMFTGGLRQVLTGWLGGRIDLPLDQLIDAAVAQALRLLEAPPGA